MAVRRENVKIEVGEYGLPPSRLCSLRILWRINAPTDPLWGVRPGSGSGPHLWGGDQA